MCQYEPEVMDSTKNLVCVCAGCMLIAKSPLIDSCQYVSRLPRDKHQCDENLEPNPAQLIPASMKLVEERSRDLRDAFKLE